MQRERVLTQRELNRTTLLRQLLLRRERLSPVRAIERLAGLQAQLASSPYLALWARLDGFERPALERALKQRRVVKALLMRATMHLVSARDLPYFDAAVRETRTLVRARGTERPPDELVELAVELTREQPRTRRELMEALGLDPRTQDPYEIRKYSWVVALARLEQTPECAFYGFRGSPRFEPADHEHPPFAEGAAHTIKRYLAAFGPATRADVSQWSGMPIRDLAPGFEVAPPAHLPRRARTRAARPPPRPARAGRRARSAATATPLGRAAARAQGPHPGARPTSTARRVIHKNGDVQQTFLVDGVVAGLWRREGDRIALEPFAPLPGRRGASSRPRPRDCTPGSASVSA